jgi:hypothetical protein
MRILRFPIACLFFTLLLGCAEQQTSQQSPPAAQAKDQMIGMSINEIATCLGKPGQSSAAGSVETLFYTYGSCTVSLTLAGGRVTAADYSVRPRRNPADGEPCAHVPEVMSCVRWLRH